jgi:hypothetical protein
MYTYFRCDLKLRWEISFEETYVEMGLHLF